VQPIFRSRTLRPLSPTIGLVLATVVAAAPLVPAQQQDLPPAREVIRRFVDAVGGEAAVRKHRTRRMTGTFELPAQGASGRLEVLAGHPDLFVLRVTLDGLGEIASGYDGQVAWMVNPMEGPRVLEGVERAQMQMDADYYGMLHEASSYVSMETLEHTTFEGTPVYKVRLVRKTGEEDLEFFAVDSGLLVGSTISRTIQMGTIQATSVMSAYKEFSGLRLATRLVQRAMGAEQVFNVTGVEFDTLDAAAFAPPPAIKTLLK